jgi:uncharacterized protein (DUF697 family)
MKMMGLSLAGVALLLVGVAMAIYGFNIKPTVGEAIGNVFDGDFTDKRNVLKFVGLALAVTGGVILAGGAFSRMRNRNA